MIEFDEEKILSEKMKNKNRKAEYYQRNKDKLM